MQAGIYKHYKGGYYQVIGVGEHTETKEVVVVYISLTGVEMPGPRIRVRPLNGKEGFLTPTSDGKTRFQYIGDKLN